MSSLHLQGFGQARPRATSTSRPSYRNSCCPCKRSTLIRAGRSSGTEERERALRQESSADDQQFEDGPYSAQNYYQQYPPYPQYAAPQPESRGVPWGWVILGGVVAIVVSKVVDFLSPSGGGPQAKMMNFMMKQAMKGAGGGSNKNMPAGFPDFSKLGAAPGMPGGFPGSGFPSPPTSSQKPTTSASTTPSIVDAQARTVEQSPGGATSTSGGPAEATRPGAKFEELKAQGRRRRRSQDGEASASSKPAFQDVDAEDASSSSAGPGLDPSLGVPPPPPGASEAGDMDEEATMEMLEQFMQDPNMQQLLYQYLPEPMRNKETFDWMLKNPEYRAQLQGMIKAQGAQLNPEVYKQMQGIDSEEVTRQLAQHGMTPSDVIQKIMSEPDLAAAFSKPQVQQAILELQSNPVAMLKYQDDPDVMLVFEKMSQMFPQVGAAPGEAGNPAETGA